MDWQDFWDAAAPTFEREEVRHGLGQHHALLEAYVRAERPESVAVVGVGFGREVALLEGLGVLRVVGLDISPAMLARAAMRAPRAELLRADVTDRLPLPDAAVALAVAFAVLSHVPPEAVHRAVSEVLRIGRRALLVELPAPPSGPCAAGAWLDGPTNLWPTNTWLHDYEQLVGAVGGVVDGVARCSSAEGATYLCTWCHAVRGTG